MCGKLMLSLEQAQSAIAAMIADYNRNPDRRKVDKAVAGRCRQSFGLYSHEQMLKADVRYTKGLYICSPRS